MAKSKHSSGSSYLANAMSFAPQPDVEVELNRLLTIQGHKDLDFANELHELPVTMAALSGLRRSAEQLAPSQDRDVYGHAFAQFGVANAIARDLLSPHTLDLEALMPAGVQEIMEAGAEGLLDLGFVQFAHLSRVAFELREWITSHRFDSVALIESPIGNSLPVQVVDDLLQKSGVRSRIVVLNAPRNDKPRLGQTVVEFAKACAEEVTGVDCVVYMDDVLTGTRYLKIFDPLQQHLAGSTFVAIALAFSDAQRPEAAKSENRSRVQRRVHKQGCITGYTSAWVDFPMLPEIGVDSGSRVLWQDPMIWGYFDIIAGKRKVNLTFDLIEHLVTILKDLGNVDSTFRPDLERAWKEDTEGWRFKSGAGSLQSIAKSIDTAALSKRLTKGAQETFPDDYSGKITVVEEIDVGSRTTFLRERFLEEVRPHVKSGQEHLVRDAVFTAFSASFPAQEVRSTRDHVAAHYVLPYNRALQQLNFRLRSRIVEAAENRWHYPELFRRKGAVSRTRPLAT